MPDDTNRLDLGLLDEVSGFRIRLAEQLTMHSFAIAFEGTGLTAGRFTALEIIDRNGGIRPARLAAAMMVESSNMTVLLRQLEQGGWIEVRPGSDRRSKALHITGAGRRRLAELRRRLRAQEDLLTEGLSEAERAVLNRLLERLVANARRRIAPRRR